jgi:predicted DNA-binding transcriptional regulator YafY
MATDIATLDESILEFLPTSRHEIKWMSTPEVMSGLEAKGHRTYIRKVRRHLESLEKKKLVISTQEEGRREILWQRVPFLSGASGNASLMVASEAVAFQMLQRIARQTLPKVILGDIDNLFRAAEVRLSQEHVDGHLHRIWPDKVDSVDGAFNLIRPTTEDDIFNVVKTALFFERVLETKYRPLSMSGDAEPSRKALWPLALVESAGVMYLVAQDPAYPTSTRKPKPLRSLFRLDRILEAQENGKTFTYPKDFSLRKFIEHEQQFDFKVEEPVFLRLAFEGNTGNHLLDWRISDDQAPPVRLEDGRLLIAATVRPSLKLRWWLRSFGASVEILEPQHLRDEFAAEYRKSASRYE